MEPTRLFPIIVLLSLVTVEYGGWALLGFLTGHGTLGPFREQFFRGGIFVENLALSRSREEKLLLVLSMDVTE